MDELDTLPELDYLSRDFASFRQLIKDQLAVLAPDWTEQHPADIGNAIIEVLAYAADYLSYYQDAVATEAYLGTARLRRSIQQHVRLLDYDWHEGCNARVWVHVHVEQGKSHVEQGNDETDNGNHAGSVVLKAHTPILAGLEKGWLDRRIPSGATYASALTQQPVVFETMHDAILFEAHNKIQFHSDDPDKPLPQGATAAYLKDDGHLLGSSLKPGDVLIFEEILDPVTGLASKADPTHRQAVRLTRVTPGTSTTGKGILRIEWSVADALSFPLALATPYGSKQPASIALGNIVLADHGQTLLEDEVLPPIPEVGRYYPKLQHKGLTFCVAYDHERALTTTARVTLQQAPRLALPAITLQELGLTPIERASDQGQQLLIDTYNGPDADYKNYLIKKWTLRSELLSSGVFTRDYAIETEEDGRAYVRFGYGTVGWQPAVAGAHCLARYRMGNGTIGNIGPDGLAHIVTDDDRIQSVRNPLAAQGGTDPSDRERARLHAPYAFQKPERCVTEDDYVVMAKRHPNVVRAVAQRERLGSWNTAIVYVQRRDDEAVDAAFQHELREWLEPYRVAGTEIEIREAHFVPLDIKLRIWVKPGHRREAVQSLLQQAFSTGVQFDGTDSFFNPSRLAFGQTVYQSQVINQAMQLTGVARVDVVRFRRMDSAVDVESIPIGPLEIIRLDNDPGHPERGRIVFLQGDL